MCFVNILKPYKLAKNFVAAAILPPPIIAV